jgi:hypothetical protein
MTNKKSILYFEDEPEIAMGARRELIQRFPEFDITVSFDGSIEIKDILKKIGGVERIAIVCTDGKLRGEMGWDVIEKLRKEGYQGPALYTGSTKLPKDKEGLYVCSAEKEGHNLISNIQKYIQR